ncbi:MAG: alpha/beta hydrolase [Burkholderiaceae bacterium]|nr:alpha/beta hydrolase [Burkholderiaceae bacterium]
MNFPSPLQTAPAEAAAPYRPRRPADRRVVSLRQQSYHLCTWGDASLVTPERPLLLLLHGWMDVGASFQFLVDELAALEGECRFVVAPDWRGFGRTQGPPVDSYWFADYLADLDALLRDPALGLAGDAAIDLVGHSMGGNVVMLYAGVRPARIRRLVNLEGFGMPRNTPEQAPRRYAQWLDELAEPSRLRPYPSLAAVAGRLTKNNPRLSADKAAWLAPHWSQETSPGQWEILGDPAHKRVNPVLYRVDEVLACWRQITAPVLWVEGRETDVTKWWGHRYPREDFEARIAEVPRLQRHLLTDCGHMLHHDQPAALAARLKAFLDDPNV